MPRSGAGHYNAPKGAFAARGTADVPLLLHDEHTEDEPAESLTVERKSS